ncbi:MAG: Gfo/Idh/MocA family oxidoreductase, partial [Planctomycetes bacterium]|nr:Gfo/Idh/MocA family oxidoreductase [Planctomycetota bacterium]
MSKLGVGIFGIGSAGHGVMHGYSTHPATEVQAICEINAQRLEAEAREHKPSLATTNYDELLARDDIQIVSVATPDHLHAEHAIKAFEAGKHVLVEKPMCTTVADARRMIAAAEKAQRLLMVSQTMRFVPLCRAIKRLYDAGELGELFFVEGSYVHDMFEYYSPTGKRYTAWRADAKSPQNILLGGGCHPVDLVLWTVNKPVRQVFCFA